MTMTLNKRIHGVPAGAIYVGRPTIWGNPFVVGKHGDRDEVLRRFEAHLRADQALLDRLGELRGKDLVCWCAPEACHADILRRLANT